MVTYGLTRSQNAFVSTGTPATGLSPTIRIRDVSDNSLVITDAAMVEVGDGFYKYDFTTFSSGTNYAIRCDGGAMLPTFDRYVFVANEPPDVVGVHFSDPLGGP